MKSISADSSTSRRKGRFGPAGSAGVVAMVLGASLFASMGEASGVTKPTATATTVAADTTIVLGGGRLLREYSPDAKMIGDEYVAVVVKSRVRTASVYVTSTLGCTGAMDSTRTPFEQKDLPIGASGLIDARLPAAATDYTGSLHVSIRLSNDLARADVRVLQGTLARITPRVLCSATPVRFALRVAHPGAVAPTQPAKAVGGALYLGAVPDAKQRTPFLMHVSADGTQISDREADLFLDCASMKPYEFLHITDYARIPVDGGGAFEFRETWSTTGDRLGLDPKHRVEITTLTRGRFAGTRAAGVVRFDAKVVEIATGTVLDTCSSQDQVFEAST